MVPRVATGWPVTGWETGPEPKMAEKWPAKWPAAISWGGGGGPKMAGKWPGKWPDRQKIPKFRRQFSFWAVSHSVAGQPSRNPRGAELLAMSCKRSVFWPFKPQRL